MIPVELVLLAVQAYATGKLYILELFHPFFRSGGGALILFLIPLLALVAYFFLLQIERPTAARWGFVVVCVASLLVTGVLTHRQISYRSGEALPLTDNDGAVQSRAAATFLLRGQNPYTADYRQTDFRIFPSPSGRGVDNLALDHYAYPPLQFLLMVPTVFINTTFDTHFDTQTLYLILFLIYCVAVVALGNTWSMRTRLLLLTLGNPWFLLLAFAGFNDITMVALLTLAAVAAHRRWWVASSVLMGCAVASKQTAWVSAPLWAAYVWFALGGAWRAWWKQLAIAAGTASVFFLPFFLWNPGAMFDDIVRYVSGAIPGSYPLSGNTILQYLRPLGLVDSPWTTFSAWPFQLSVGATMVLFAYRALRRRPRASVWLGWSAMTILAITLVSRFAPDNYFLAIAELIVAAYGLSLIERGSHGET